MKWNLIISSFAVAAFSTNVLAINPHHGKLLDHKEWNDAKIKCSTNDVSANNAVIKSLLLTQEKSKKRLSLQNKQHDAILVIEHAEPAKVTPGTHLVQGFKATYIENFTPLRHTYTLMTKTCIFPHNDHETEQCTTTQDVFSLEPNEFIDQVKGLVVSYDFSDTSDEYTFAIYTTAIRDDAETVFATGSTAIIEVGNR